MVGDRNLLSSQTDCVTNDSYGGAKAAVLPQTGHRRIGYVRPKQRICYLCERERGVRDALDRTVFSLVDTIEIGISSEGAFQDFDSRIKQLLHSQMPCVRRKRHPARHDLRFKKHGCRVPDDISVISFDDIPMCEMLNPLLKMVNTFKEEPGRMTVESRADGSSGARRRIRCPPRDFLAPQSPSGWSPGSASMPGERAFQVNRPFRSQLDYGNTERRGPAAIADSRLFVVTPFPQGRSPPGLRLPPTPAGHG